MKKHPTYSEFLNERKTDWSGVVISTGKGELKKLAREYKQDDMDGWKIRANHVTIKAGNLPEDYEHKEGDTVEVTVTHVGWNESCLAAKVKGIKTFNKLPHVTLAFHPTKGKGGYNSNNITSWKSVTNFKIKGKIKLGHTSFPSNEGKL